MKHKYKILTKIRGLNETLYFIIIKWIGCNIHVMKNNSWFDFLSRSLLKLQQLTKAVMS